jgi:hypothetical protein
MCCTCPCQAPLSYAGGVTNQQQYKYKSSGMWCLHRVQQSKKTGLLGLMTLKMKALQSFHTSETAYTATVSQPRRLHLPQHCHKNLNSHISSATSDWHILLYVQSVHQKITIMNGHFSIPVTLWINMLASDLPFPTYPDYTTLIRHKNINASTQNQKNNTTLNPRGKCWFTRVCHISFVLK